MNSKQATFAVLLFSSLLIFASLTITPFRVSPYVTGESTKMVHNETELKNAIDNAPSKGTTLSFDNDIALTGVLTIPNGKDITLASNKSSGYYKLFGRVIVADGGVFRLDGIIITNGSGYQGGGVYVSEKGKFVMYSGEVFRNSVIHWGAPYEPATCGGGVYNAGVFEMFGGKISNNTAYGLGTSDSGYGGGVYNSGTFTMSGGEISGNTVGVNGGGVCNAGTFTMSGGKITGNTAYSGGGVHNGGTFKLSGGAIDSNIGYYLGGGVCNDGVFTMSGGEITGNSGNNAGNRGGGVYNCYGSTFDRRGGVISGNSATYEGDNVYPEDSGGSSSDNTGGTSNTNTEPPNGNDDGSFNGNDESTIGGFSLRDVVIIGVGVGGIVVGVVGIVLFFSSKKQLESIGKI